MKRIAWLAVAVGLFAFVALVPHERLPPLLRRGLTYVAPAVLAAIILPELTRPGGTLDLSSGNHRLIAGTLATLVAWRSKNIWLTILVGMVALWVLSAL